MSEEQVVEQTENANAGAPAEVSQQDLADQAFNDLFGDSTPKETAKPAEKPQQVAQPQQPKAENKEVQQPAQKPEGIFSTFFKEDNGQQVSMLRQLTSCLAQNLSMSTKGRSLHQTQSRQSRPKILLTRCGKRESRIAKSLKVAHTFGVKSIKKLLTQVIAPSKLMHTQTGK